MNYKKKSIIFFSSIVVLVISVVIVVYQYVGNGTKEIRAAKDFVGLLYYNDMVDKTGDYEALTYKSMKKAGATDDESIYSVTTGDFGIDINSNYDVVGFANKVATVGDSVITVEEAKTKATNYLDIIYEGDFKLKEVATEISETKVTYYKVVFTRYDGEYPFYTDEIVVNIDKNTGLLASYTNLFVQADPERVKLSVNMKDAEQKVIQEFCKLNTDGIICEETRLAYCDNKDTDETELAYIITVKGKDLNNKEVRYKYSITTEKGTIINFEKDNVSTTKTSS